MRLDGMRLDGMRLDGTRLDGTRLDGMRRAHPRRMDARRTLSWLSLTLGAAQVAAPARVARLIGTPGGRQAELVTRLVGVRELTAGAGLVSGTRPAGWLWARVAGDLMDLALLSAALTSKHNHRGRVAASLAAVGGVAAADVWAARQVSSAGQVQLTKAITINRQPDEVYRFWRDFRKLPQFMSHVHSVAVLDNQRSHWTVSAPVGRRVEWDAEITQDQPNELIAWRSLPGAAVENAGTVRFVPAPGARGTEVRVEMSYQPPAGPMGAMFARLFGQEPRQQVQADLRKLKQVLEAGEVLRSSATLHGTQLLQPPAQPTELTEMTAGGRA
jgi:uncharacterized membrane protein